MAFAAASPLLLLLSLPPFVLALLYAHSLAYRVLYPCFRLLFGTLYPAYASYKAVRTKNVKEYVKWMMYWIVFAIFSSIETFTDVFFSFWFPFYYEIKIALLIWLLSPATKGSSILYRKFVHPMLSRREQDIDEYIAKAKEQGYHTVLNLGTKGVNYATTVIMQTAIKGGGGLVNQLRRSYSLSDLSSDNDGLPERSRTKALMGAPEDEVDEMPTTTDGRHLRSRGYSPRRSVSGSGRVEMYFPEVDVDVRQHPGAREPSSPFSHIRSSEDISSGYSSAEPLYASHHPAKSEGLSASRELLVRTASVGGSMRSVRSKSTRGGAVSKRGGIAEDSDWCISHDSTDEEDHFYDIPSLSPSSALSIPTSVPSATSLQVSVTENIISFNKLERAISSSLDSLGKTVPVADSDVTDYEISLSDDCQVTTDTVLEVSCTNARVSLISSNTDTITVGKNSEANSVTYEPSGVCETQALADSYVTNDDTCGSEILELPTDLILEPPASEKIEQVSLVDDGDSVQIELKKSDVVDAIHESNSVPLALEKFDVDIIHESNVAPPEWENPGVGTVHESNSVPIELEKSGLGTVHESNSVTLELEKSVLGTVHESNSIPIELEKSGLGTVHEGNSFTLELEQSDVVVIQESNSVPLELKKSDTVGNKINELDCTENIATNNICMSEATKTEIAISNKGICETELTVRDMIECKLSNDKVFSLSDEISGLISADLGGSHIVKDDSKEVDQLLTHAEPVKLQTHVPSVQMPTAEGVRQLSQLDDLCQPVDEHVRDAVHVVPVTSNTESGNAVSSLQAHVGASSSAHVEPVSEQTLGTQPSAEHPTVSEHKQTFLEEPCSSVELQDECPEQSGSQVSLRKECRAGRYYKRPAPEPPCWDGTSDATQVEQGLHLTSLVGDEKQETTEKIYVKELAASQNNVAEETAPKLTDVAGYFGVHKVDQQTDSSEKSVVRGATPSPRPAKKWDDEAAITGRLVLKPGVVRNVGPALEGGNSSSEVFISKSKPKRKSSKRKYVESAVSRIFAMPQLTSLFPFWRETPGPRKLAGSAESSRRNSSVSSLSLGEEGPARCTGVRKSPSPCSVGSDGRGSRKGSYVTFADGDSDRGETSSAHEVKGILKKTDSGNVKVRELSHSPTRSRQPAPLADWED